MRRLLVLLAGKALGRIFAPLVRVDYVEVDASIADTFERYYR